MASSASPLRPSTPPPSTNLHTPTTPKHGWEDTYQPYSPRKSARVSSQRARAAYTQHTLHPDLHSPTSKSIASASTPRSSHSGALSPPSSRMESTKKPSSANNGEGVSGALTYEPAALGVPPTMNNHGMLPTPIKTPTQRTTGVVPGIRSIARNLFPIRGESAEEAMPSPKKARKKYGGFSMGGAEDADAPIAIYTDSTDRIPEADLSADNPFYGPGAADPEPATRSSKRRKILIPGEGEVTVEEAERRKDGLIFCFRGKMVFRKFTDEEELDVDDGSDAEIDNALAADLPARLRDPLPRSSIKPRLLFPTPEQIKEKEMRSQMRSQTRSQVMEDDEEADTDIDESNKVTTPKDQVGGDAATPNAPRFAPASPPVTTRATRSQQMGTDMTPDAVRRHRSHSASADLDTPPALSRKRRGEALKRRGRAKRARGE